MNIIKSIAIKSIKSILWIIDPDHRIKHEIGMDDMKKFTHIIDQDFQSDFGRVSKAYRTVPYETWQLKTETKTLIAADKHRVIRDDHSCAWIQDLKSGDLIKTDNGLEKVIEAKSLNIRTHMYCVEVNTVDQTDQNNHLYYTNGVLSHNTTCAVAFILWQAMFVDDSTVLITANTYNQALEIMQRIRYAYENMTKWIKAGVKEYNKGSIVFDNGSRILSRATTPSAGRGLSISLLFCDEFAHIGNARSGKSNLQNEFWTAIRPVLSTGGKCIITSTPKTDTDLFAEIWHGAIDTKDEFGNLIHPEGLGRNDFYASLAIWSDEPSRDEKWKETELASMGQARFMQEHSCLFVSDEETLVDYITLTKIKSHDPIGYTGNVRWYQEPEPNKTFIIALDPAGGTGGNNAAIQVFQIPEMIQIAEWQHNKTDARGQIRILRDILITLNDFLRDNPEQHSDPEIYWSLENNGLGNAHLVVIDDTGEDRFPGTLVSEPRRSGMGRSKKGLTTTNPTKYAACLRLKSLIERNKMMINSQNLLNELKNFVAYERTFKAKSGATDDLVSATLIVLRILAIVLTWGIEGDDLKEQVEDLEMLDEDETEPPAIVI